MRPSFFLAGLVVLAGRAAVAAEEARPFAVVNRENAIRSPQVAEASGLAVSPTHPDFLWVINDSGNAAEVHLINADGTPRGKFSVPTVTNRDWEDIAAFKLEGKPYLLVADTGDNESHHDSCMLHLFAEPVPPPAGQSLAGTLAPVWTLHFRYEDGPRDCESVGVDVKGRKILLLSKRTKPPCVYELPLALAPAKKMQIAHKIGTTAVEPPPGTLPVPYGNQPTGLCIAADGSVAAVVTYLGTFLFPHAADESWAATFARKPLALEPHRLQQAESVALTPDGKTLYVVSEGARSPIVVYRRK